MKVGEAMSVSVASRVQRESPSLKYDTPKCDTLTNTMVRASAPSITRSAFYLVLAQGATTALAVVLTGAIGRALGPADFGSWYVVSVMATFAYVFVDWGYSPYIIREVARHPARAGEL